MMNHPRTDPRHLALMLGIGLLACGGGEPPASGEGEPESAAEQPAGPGLTAEVSGDLEKTIEGRGDLTCIGQGDMGPGYLNIRDRRSPEQIVLRTPVDAEPGTHPLTSGANAGQFGEVYVGALNLPLEGVIYADAAEGTLTLETFEAQPGGTVRGTFEFSTASGALVQGRFDFVVPDDARESC